MPPYHRQQRARTGTNNNRIHPSIHPFSARTRVDDGGWVCSCSLRLEQNFLPSHWSFIERDQMLNHFDFKRLGVFERARCRAALQMCDVRSIRHVSIRWEAEYNPKRRYCSLCVVGSSKNKTKQSALIKQVKRPSAISCKLSKNRLIYIPSPPHTRPTSFRAYSFVAA